MMLQASTRNVLRNVGHRARSLVCVLLLAALTGACATGSGYQNTQTARDGIGGTGALESTDMARDGIGGTGDMISGVFGTITGYGSIIVNGVHIDGAQDLVEAELMIGEVVSVRAAGDVAVPGTRLMAQAVKVHHALTGQISVIDQAAGRMTVGGQVVEVTPDDDPSRMAFATLMVGDKVRISGLTRPDGVIVASRVDQVPAETAPSDYVAAAPGFGGAPLSVSVEGYASADGDAVRLGDLSLMPSGDAFPEVGSRVIVKGVMDRAGVVRVQAVVPVGTIVTLLSTSPREARGGALNRPARFDRPDRLTRPEAPARIERPTTVRPERPVRPETPGRERPARVPMV